MYELSCPACHKARRLAFVRVGARSVCPDCRQPFIIKKDHFRRQPVSVQADAAGERDPLVAVGGSTPPPPTHEHVTRPSVLTSQALASLASAAPQSAVHSAAAAAGQGSTEAPFAGAAGQGDGSADSAAELSEVPITAVPTAQVAARGSPPPVSRLIATRIRQKRRRNLLAVLTLVIVLLLFGIIATLLVGLNRQAPEQSVAQTEANASPAAAAAAAQTISLFKVGPAQWETMDEPAYAIAHVGPLRLEDYGLITQGQSDAAAIVGSVVCNGFDVYPSARLELLLLDSNSQIFAKAQLALTPMTNQRDAARQHFRISLPMELAARISTIDWEIISGQPLNDGVLVTPARVTRSGQGRDTQLKLTFENTFASTIYKLNLSIRPADHRGRPLAHWAGQWEGHLEPGQSLLLQVATPMQNLESSATNWQIQAAAELALQPLISTPDDMFIP